MRDDSCTVGMLVLGDSASVFSKAFDRFVMLADQCLQSEKRKEKKKKRKDYAFWRQFNEKPSIIPGCPGLQPDLFPDVCIWGDMMFTLDSMSQFMLVLLSTGANPGSLLKR